jgi:hypothetical protein
VYTTEYPSLLVRASVQTERPPPSEEVSQELPATAVPHPTTIDPPALTAAAPERPRDIRGHCWDGHPCDHPDHGDQGAHGGPIHLMH